MNQLQLNEMLLRARTTGDKLINSGKREEGILTIQVASLVAQRVLALHPDWYKQIDK